MLISTGFVMPGELAAGWILQVYAPSRNGEGKGRKHHEGWSRGRDVEMLVQRLRQHGCLEKQNLPCGKRRGSKSVNTVCKNVNYFYLKSTLKVCKSKNISTKYLITTLNIFWSSLLSVSPSTSWPFLFCQGHNFDFPLSELPLPCPFFLPSWKNDAFPFLLVSQSEE